MKLTGKRSAGNPHAAFVVAGIGNMAMVGLGTRFTIERVNAGNSLPKVRAPVFDPTLGERAGLVTVLWAGNGPRLPDTICRFPADMIYMYIILFLWRLLS